MATPHLHIYNKPKEQSGSAGERIQEVYEAFGYRHTILAVGNFDTAECDIKVSRAESEHIFSNFVGNHVRFFMDNPVVPIWEGYISRITMETGGLTFTRSLDEMANAVFVTYDDTTGVTDSKNTTIVNNTDSQAVYGVKMGSFEVGSFYTQSGSGVADNVRDKKLAQLAWPLVSVVQGGGNALRLHIECKGFFHTAEWVAPDITDTTSENADLAFQYAALTAIDSFNSDTFWNTTGSGSTSDIDANGAFTLSRENKPNQTMAEKINKIVEAGDGANNWVWGVPATDGNNGRAANGRNIYYRQANADVEYKMNVYSDPRVYTLHGRHVRNWEVRPDRGIRVTDVLPFFVEDTSLQDPRSAYIKSVTWNAESNQLTWQSDDDVLTWNGVFGLSKTIKRHGTRFGADRRYRWA